MILLNKTESVCDLDFTRSNALCIYIIKVNTVININIYTVKLKRYNR